MRDWLKTWAAGLILLGIMCSGSPIHAQEGSGDRPPITRDNAAQVALIGTLERGWINALAWSSDGAYLAVTASNGTYIYNASDWEAPPQTLPSYGSAPVNVVWRAGADELVLVDAQGALYRWALADGVFTLVSDINIDMSNALLTMNRDRRTTFDPLAFTADGSIYVALGMNVGVYILKLPCEDEVCIHDVTHNTNIPTDPANQRLFILPDGTPFSLTRRVAVSSNGQVMAEITGSASGVAVLDGTGQPTHVIQPGFIVPKYEFDSTPNGITLSADGTLLAAGGCTWLDDGLSFCQQSGIKLFDVASGRLFQEPQEKFANGIEAIAFSTDGTKLAAADNRIVRVWDLTTGEAQAYLTGYGTIPAQLVAHPVQPVLFSAHAAWKTGNGGGINVWSLEALSTGSPIASLPSDSPIAISPDGQWLVAGNAGDYFNGEITHPTLWNVSNPAAPYALTDLTDLTRTQQVDGVQFSPDSTLLAVTTENNVFMTKDGAQGLYRHRELRIFETQTFSLVSSTTKGEPAFPEFSPDGRWFTYWISSKVQNVYSIDSLWDGEEGLSDPYLTFENAGLVFPPQGELALLFVLDTKEVQLWDLAAKKQVGLDENRPFYSGTYNADGSLLVIGNSILETTGYTELGVAGTSGSGAVFSADGRYLFLRSGSGGYYNDPSTNPDNVVSVYAVPQSPDEVYVPPTPHPYPTHCGSHAKVNVLEGDTLNVRATASPDGEILAKLESGTIVELADEFCISAYQNSYIWLNIRTAEGLEGWAVMFADGLQTLNLID